jgi:desulfoferrodoxin (superoxide reductase-like protein)
MSDVLSHKSLQNTVKELNAKFGLKLKHISTRENFIKWIVDSIGNATEEQQDLLSPDAVDVYNALLAVPAPEPGGSDDEGTEELCQAYGTAYEPSDVECTECVEAGKCEELTVKAKTVILTKPPKEKKEKPVKEAKEKKEKVEVEKSRYGHKVGSMAAVLDDLMWKGSTMEEMVDTLVKDFGKPEEQATAKIRAHYASLTKKRDVPVDRKDGVYKAQIETN